MSLPVKFGTDGWRAVIAEDFTVANVERVAQAAADFWNAFPKPGTARKVIVGYDRRFLSGESARHAAAVFAGNGFQVVLTPEPTPTPAVSLAVKEQRAIGGVIITAGRNAPRFNGLKLKSYYGGSAGSDTCRAIEQCLDRRPVRTTLRRGERVGKAAAIQDLRPAHFKALKKLVDFKLIANSGIRVAHDAMFGVGAGCFDQLLGGTTCRVTTLNGEHDPLFGGLNPDPARSHCARSSAFLKRHPHDVSLVTDGGADCLGLRDSRSNALTSQQLVCLLLHHLIVNRQGRGRVVKALTVTSVVDKMCSANGLEVTETAVGFGHIAAEMLKGNVLLGADESGGIGLPGHIPERDGLAAGLMLLELLATEQVPLTRLVADLNQRFGPHCFGRIDAPFPLERQQELMALLRDKPPEKLLGSPLLDLMSYDGVKFIAKDTSWLMLRCPRTEPVVRIYAEAPTKDAVSKLLKLGLRLMKKGLVAP
jgi:phosphomannomutase